MPAFANSTASGSPTYPSPMTPTRAVRRFSRSSILVAAAMESALLARHAAGGEPSRPWCPRGAAGRPCAGLLSIPVVAIVVVIGQPFHRVVQDHSGDLAED